MRNDIRERLFPDDRTYVVAVDEIATRLARAATLLVEGFDNPARLPEVAAAIQVADQEVDQTLHAVDRRVGRMLIPPVDREDIHLLAMRFRRVMDILGGMARRAVSLHVFRRHEPAVQLAGVLVRATQEIHAAVGHLRDGRGVLECCRAIKGAEEQGDTIWEAAVSALFADAPDPVEVLRWKALYDQLEDALDACEDVANALETITVKRA
jgi:uncharacterized protein